jgi:hypothetical protein
MGRADPPEAFKGTQEPAHPAPQAASPTSERASPSRMTILTGAPRQKGETTSPPPALPSTPGSVGAPIGPP